MLTIAHSNNRSLRVRVITLYSAQRCHSSLPSPSTKTPATQHEPVFPTSIPRKQKIELKPGPRPTAVAGAQSASAQHDKPTAPTPQPTAAQPRAEASKANEPSESEKPPSKIKIAIADVVKAAEQGALAPPPPDASKMGKLWHQVKELFKFYVRGLKQLLVHRQIVKDLKARGGQMTWEETHFVKTYKEDMVKLIPFLLILLILEEALPLVVLYAPFLLPSTCILPNQRARILWKRDDAQFNARSEARSILLSVESLQDLAEGGVKEMPEDLVTAMVKVFGLSTRGPVALQRRRLEKHLEYLMNDDCLLALEETMGSHLDLRNLKVVMSERGFLASADEPDLRSTLDKRLQALGEDKAEWKPRSLQFLLKDLLESKRDVKPTPVD
ncbi:LETM1 and EF-hand domain-containing protein anon-60Da, mitochondrial [Rhizoctonia solani]|uniref:LETM1 and EF-hand domain-containing protein anon-60Da, mitochondrial n=1 Tax=Rhizoctonia solani TaxID=456999 RepID=A0A8H8NWW9_9AGAM|nr:LETM1 and EF-hand domain-containing protein anon-60Da, mitochondrial [Rhizoctonia solani]QRW21601.1 LETM1 and EF-hand domain-containing protein anon-60Da, mitochondrial [Rhizoctonia solani]